MGLINWIFDIYQHHRIDQAHKEASEARREAALRSPGGSIDAERLERAVGELALAVKTLQRVMLDKGVCNVTELQEKLRQIDLEDGRADGCTPIGS